MATELDELTRIADDLDRVTLQFERIGLRLSPPPTTTPVVAYMSGRWKLRDGTMYGR